MSESEAGVTLFLANQGTHLSYCLLTSYAVRKKEMVPSHRRTRNYSPDCTPDHPLNSDLVIRLKDALEVGDEKIVMDLLCHEVKHANAVLELSNDDWMKAPTAQLHPLVLVGKWIICAIQSRLPLGKALS